MQDLILRTNGIPVYGFLSTINARRPPEGAQGRGKVLDCGAGGPVPPLALFELHGFETWGIDLSNEQLEKAAGFCAERGLNVRLRAGDMRQMPFEDETFDYVYEHYSMCHLGKQDTARAVSEMYRVLKPHGLCFLGVISADSWPTSLFGKEEKPGEYWGTEGGQRTCHSMFTEAEADELVSAWEILTKEKSIRYMRVPAKELSLTAWIELYREARDKSTPAAWQARYPQRTNAFQYVHTYYILEKPG
jgi:SAM-dependent methyltransferase